MSRLNKINLQKFTTSTGGGGDLSVDPQDLLQDKKDSLHDNNYYDSAVEASAYSDGEVLYNLLVAVFTAIIYATPSLFQSHPSAARET